MSDHQLVSLSVIIAELQNTATRLMRYHVTGQRFDGSESLQEFALSGLRYGRLLADRALEGRWMFAADALAGGAPLQRVAHAMGLSDQEVVQGLRAWADEQLRLRLITHDRHADVLDLIQDRVR
jgi:hypothetical protein